MEDQSVIDHIIEMKGDIASIKTMLEPLAPRVDSHETRLAATENDVKAWKRAFLGLWALAVVAGTWAIGWFKG